MTLSLLDSKETIEEKIMNRSKSYLILLSTLGVIACAGTISQAQADPCGAANYSRQAEVLHRDRVLNHELNSDRGHLSGKYSVLKREDAAIRRQERSDVYANGGYLTRAQQYQLNREENHLQHQIDRDYQG